RRGRGDAEWRPREDRGAHPRHSESPDRRTGDRWQHRDAAPRRQQGGGRGGGRGGVDNRSHGYRRVFRPDDARDSAGFNRGDRRNTGGGFNRRGRDGGSGPEKRWTDGRGNDGPRSDRAGRDSQDDRRGYVRGGRDGEPRSSSHWEQRGGPRRDERQDAPRGDARRGPRTGDGRTREERRGR